MEASQSVVMDIISYILHDKRRLPDGVAGRERAGMTPRIMYGGADSSVARHPSSRAFATSMKLLCFLPVRVSVSSASKKPMLADLAGATLHSCKSIDLK